MASAIEDTRELIDLAAPFMAEPRPSIGAIELAYEQGERFLEIYAAMASMRGLFKGRTVRAFTRLRLGLALDAPFVAKDISCGEIVAIAKEWARRAKTIDAKELSKEQRDKLHEYRGVLQDIAKLGEDPEWTEKSSFLAMTDRAGRVQAIAEHIDPKTANAGFVCQLATAPENLFGGCRGAGTAAIVEIFLRNVSGVGRVTLSSTLTSRRFYEKLGFEALSEKNELDLPFEKGVALWIRSTIS